MFKVRHIITNNVYKVLSVERISAIETLFLVFNKYMDTFTWIKAQDCQLVE